MALHGRGQPQRAPARTDAGFVPGKRFRPALPGVHLALAAVAIPLFYMQNRPLDMILSEWGFLFGFFPASWSAWIARTLADKEELAGGISVASPDFSSALLPPWAA